MKKIKHNFILLSVFWLSIIDLNSNVYANRFENEEKKTHCTPLPEEQCVPSVKRWKERGCITQAELDYAMAKRPVPIPLCLEVGDTWSFLAWCFCSCFAKGTKILIDDTYLSTREWVPVEIVVEDLARYLLVVPSAKSTMADMKYDSVKIHQWSSGPESNPLVALNLQDGSELVLTGNHQVLHASGRLVEASALKVGDLLVKYDGVPNRVIAIEERQVQDDVYNFLTSGNTTLSHFVFADGLTVGDLLWENSPEDEVKNVYFPKN